MAFPEMWDESPEKTHKYILKAAKAAEELRKQWPENLVFSVGSELTLFMQGIFDGDNFLERINSPSFWKNIKEGTHNKLLNDFLFKTSKEIRQVFSGKITYASAPLETVDWSLFDFVCIDMYRDARIKDSYGDIIKQYFNYKKPVIISEFGCCTYQGAEDAGGMGFLIVDFSKGINQSPTQLNGKYIRDESVQARELKDQLSILDNIGIDGAFIFTFLQPTFSYNENPKYDLDMASYSLVKSYIAIRGKTYPDMQWEPKQSFNAVADYYAKKTEQQY